MSLISSIQLNSDDSINGNLAKIDYFTQVAHETGAQLVLLPENCGFFGKHQSQYQTIAEQLGDGPTQTKLANIAKRHNIWIIVGSFPTIEDGKPFQTLLVYNNCGELVEYYHKCHLFDVTLPNKSESYRESDSFTRGLDKKIVKTPVGIIGLSICYDLRFPEHFRNLVDMGSEIFVLPAAFTYQTGKAHWETLLKARAIENQCFVVASGQCGSHPNSRETWGHSMIIDPWGSILTQAEHSTGTITANIDLSTLHEQRQGFPALKHRMQ